MSIAAIIVVDMQNDFVEGGALAVAGGRALVPKINDFLRRHKAALVIFTQDWHPANHSQFKVNGGIWPVHCVQGTAGAELVSGLDRPPGSEIVRKGTLPELDGYSGFEGKNEAGLSLQQILHRANVHTIHLCGIATDYCVRATALDAAAAGYEVRVHSDLVAGVEPQTTAAALDEFRNKGIRIEEAARRFTGGLR